MKQAFLLTLVLFLGTSLHAQKNKTEDVSILRPDDRSYADATNTAALIEGRGLHINSIHKSKMEGFFRDVWKAAVYKTDKGAFQVIFFDEPKQAERITVKEVREGRRFIYSFEGQPHPDPPRDVMNAGYKMFFIMRDKMFIIVNDEKLYETLKTVFQSM
jgi:hypothetical protein